MKQLNKFYPHLLAVLGFVLISLIYFYPVLQGKEISQSDIAQYTGMAKEQNDFRATEHTEPYWTNSAFGGMPTYQLGANYPHDYIGKLDDLLRFLPRPADYLFLYFLGFYALMLVLKADPLKAFFGALAFGFSTYLIVILGVGHNAKAHAIAYMPMVIAGILLVFRRQYIYGGLLTLFAAALEINANHFQMTYYLLILILAIVVFYIVKYLRNQEYKPLLISFGVFAVAGIVAIGVNAANLMATAEYADFSIRGKSELTFNPDGSKDTTSSAMKYDYITEYSYGIAESFNLMAPRLFGGGNGEKLSSDSSLYEFMVGQGVPPDQAKDAMSQMPMYWGDQPLVAAPAYIGAVVFFLCMLALFVEKRKIKYAFIAGAVLSLLLSWGKNFPMLTDFFIDHVPMYDKFRAVSSIQVILELCAPVLAVMGLQSFFRMENKDVQLKSLYKASGIYFGIIALLLVIKSQFSFSAAGDAYFMENYGPQFVDALKLDRKAFYSADLLRSGVLALLAGGALWLFIKNKFAQHTAVIIVGIVMIGDLFFIDKNYVDSQAFVSSSQVNVPFQASPSDLQILQDKSHYRVFEVNAIHNARTSYFHKSLSGYSAVRPRRMEQLLEYQISKNNINVLNMLNTKYIIQVDEKGQEFPVQNPEANGNAWFIREFIMVDNADAEMKALDKFDSKNVAILNTQDFPGMKIKPPFIKDSMAIITLTEFKSNYLKYTSENPKAGIAVFSEMYYKNGWNAYIDGRKTTHFRVDYVLRAMQVPAGKHTIEFKFEPEVVKTGGTIALISSLGMLILLVGGIYVERKKNLKA